MSDSQALMRLAIDAARTGMAKGQTPFGCAISIGGVVAVEHNCVLATTDITAHAEMTAIRAACAATRRLLLEGAQVASTCEPCPMCMSALHWARVERVYYGASIADAAEVGFNELRVSSMDLLRMGGSRVVLVPDVLRDECRALFDEWRRSPAYRVY